VQSLRVRQYMSAASCSVSGSPPVLLHRCCRNIRFRGMCVWRSYGDNNHTELQATSLYGVEPLVHELMLQSEHRYVTTLVPCKSACTCCGYKQGVICSITLHMHHAYLYTDAVGLLCCLRSPEPCAKRCDSHQSLVPFSLYCHTAMLFLAAVRMFDAEEAVHASLYS
jgi:hypothetical protein